MLVKYRTILLILLFMEVFCALWRFFCFNSMIIYTIIYVIFMISMIMDNFINLSIFNEMKFFYFLFYL